MSGAAAFTPSKAERLYMQHLIRCWCKSNSNEKLIISKKEAHYGVNVLLEFFLRDRPDIIKLLPAQLAKLPTETALYLMLSRIEQCFRDDDQVKFYF